MNLAIRFGRKCIEYGESRVVKGLEKKYGRQTPRTAKNGTRGFQRTVNVETITTCVDSNFNVIAEVKHKRGITKSSIVKIKKNPDGDIVEVTHSRSATNFRKTTTENLETGEVKSIVFNIEPVEGKYKYTVTSTNIDKSGNITQNTKNVKVKGKESPLDQPDVKPSAVVI